MLVYDPTIGVLDEQTISAHIKFNDIADADVDDAEKPLILLLKFLLVEYLYGKDAVFCNFPAT